MRVSASRQSRRFPVSRTLFFALLSLAAMPAVAAPDVEALEDLGKRVFFDNISNPARQACASCHAPNTGWTAPLSLINALACRGTRRQSAHRRGTQAHERFLLESQCEIR